MKKGILPICMMLTFAAAAADISGPDVWKTVDAKAVAKWQEERQASAELKVWPGVVADLEKREVVLLAEAAGHRAGVAVEFGLIGPLSDRAYEALAVTVAKPSDIAKAIEAIGCAPGRCIGGLRNQFWPVGNRLSVSFRQVGVSKAGEFQTMDKLLSEDEPKEIFLPSAQIIYTGGRREGERFLADSVMPASVLSFYNACDTIFDLTGMYGQSQAYGRIKVTKTLKQGDLLEFRFTPVRMGDGSLSMKSLKVCVSAEGTNVLASLSVEGKSSGKVALDELVKLIRKEALSGHDLFLGVDFAENLTVRQAAGAAGLFALLDGKGVKLDGCEAGKIFYQAFLPKEKWRERKDRNPQPFELHLTYGADGKLARKLVFIHEDWSGESLDPKLEIREFPFSAWEELPELITKVGGKENKVNVLFVFAPSGMEIGEFKRALELTCDRLPLVHIFAE